MPVILVFKIGGWSVSSGPTFGLQENYRKKGKSDKTKQIIDGDLVIILGNNAYFPYFSFF